MMSEIKILRCMGACEDALRWLETQPDFFSAYYTCPHAPWLWWLYRKLIPITPKQSVKFACACCRDIWPLLMDQRSRNAVELAERSLGEDVPMDELKTAYTAAASSAERAADWAANWAVASAVDWSAASAASSAERAAYAACWAANATDGYPSVAKRQADRARRVVKFKDVQKAMEKLR